jgi:hypothetical protein
MQDMKDRLKNRQVLLNEIGTLHDALEGVVALAGWAYEQTDVDARRALTKIRAIVELTADRTRELHRGLIED